MPKLGNLAPAFTLKDQNGDDISLKDFRGEKHVVLYFYPKAMTPGCTAQACGLRDSLQSLEQSEAVALGVSPDPVARLKKFEEKEGLNFTLLSDEITRSQTNMVYGAEKIHGPRIYGHYPNYLYHQ